MLGQLSQRSIRALSQMLRTYRPQKREQYRPELRSRGPAVVTLGGGASPPVQIMRIKEFLHPSPDVFSLVVAQLRWNAETAQRELIEPEQQATIAVIAYKAAGLGWTELVPQLSIGDDVPVWNQVVLGDGYELGMCLAFPMQGSCLVPT